MTNGAPAIALDTGAVASLRRIRAVLRRHAYLILKSWTRIVSMMYYPTVTMVVWAFVTLYLAPTNNFLKDAPGFFIGAVLLWDVLFRGQLGVSLTFIEELYARNLGNLFVSPLTLPEYIVGQIAMSVLRALIGVGGACIFAWILFRYSIFSLGFPLLAFFANLLVFGWAIGLAMSGMIMRLGLGAEELAWAAIFIVAPISGVYYPIAVLPGWMQAIAWATPSAHVFEGMRGALLHGVFLWERVLAGGGAERRLRRARRRGIRVVGALRARARHSSADGGVRWLFEDARVRLAAARRHSESVVAGSRRPRSAANAERDVERVLANPAWCA